jgi:reactive intermediate/imine deaminase
MKNILLLCSLFFCHIISAQIYIKNGDKPYSSAVITDNTIYVSGQIGNIEAGKKKIQTDFETEVRQVLDKIKKILEENGSSMNQVLKVQVMLTDMKKFEAFNKIYLQYFPEKRPARSTFGVKKLVFGAKVEIDCIALLKVKN